MIERRVSTAVLVIAMLLGMIPILSLAAPSHAPTAQEGTNLLRNPGFEADWGTEASHRARVFPDEGEGYETIRGEIMTPPGWTTWYRHTATWAEPEVNDTAQNPDPRRTRTGQRAMRLFTYQRRHDGGFYQTVGGLQPGQTVRFSAYGHSWSCDTMTADATSCGDPWGMVLQVGVDPQGGTSPFSTSVVWSGEQISPDEYRRIGPVSTQVGPGGAVTVFLRSTAKWPVQHNDAYWDDASLVTTAPGEPPTPTPPAEEPEPTEPPEEEPTETPGPSPTPLPTATPRPDGAIVHIVEAGETLFGIARMYNVSADQIRELNAGSIGPDDMIRVGQELVISVPDEEAPAATPVPETPTPTPDAEPEATPTPEPEPDPEPEGATICVLAFHDRDGDGTRDPNTEELLPNVSFTIADASGVVDEYMTDGVSEPYCFTGLAPGSYRVIQQPPGGYEATSATEQNVALAEGTSFDFQFGVTRIEEAESPEETEEEEVVEPAPVDDEPAEPGEGLVLADALSIFARVAGILVLILAGVIAVLFVLSRRRRPY